MDKRTIAEKFGNKKSVSLNKLVFQMEKKVSSSKKYEGVKSNLNTGKTMKNVEIISKILKNNLDQVTSQLRREALKNSIG